MPSTAADVTTLATGRAGRRLYVIGVLLFAAVLVAGIAQSLRIDRHLPSIDLFGSGSREYIDLLLAEKKYAAAIEQLRMQTRLLPLEADNYEELGNLLRQEGKPEEARVQFEQLVRLKPEYAEGYHLLGSTYLDTNQPELAAQQFADAAELDPRSPTVFNSMGVALAQLGMLREAEVCFAKAVELDPEFVDARINLDRARSEQQLAP